MREPLSRIVWLTETKIRRRYFFILRPLRRRHGWIPCVPARTKDKRRHRRRLSFVSSVICLADRWRWAAVAGRRAPAFPETFSTERRERMREIWGCMVRKATFECHRKGAERSFISALSCHLRTTREHSRATMGPQTFDPKAGSGKCCAEKFLSPRESQRCSTIALMDVRLRGASVVDLWKESKG